MLPGGTKLAFHLAHYSPLAPCTVTISRACACSSLLPSSTDPSLPASSMSVSKAEHETYRNSTHAASPCGVLVSLTRSPSVALLGKCSGWVSAVSDSAGRRLDDQKKPLPPCLHRVRLCIRRNVARSTRDPGRLRCYLVIYASNMIVYTPVRPAVYPSRSRRSGPCHGLQARLRVHAIHVRRCPGHPHSSPHKVSQGGRSTASHALKRWPRQRLRLPVRKPNSTQRAVGPLRLHNAKLGD